MEKLLERHKECYLLSLTEQGAKLPVDFDISNLMRDQEDSTLQVITQKIQDLQIEMENMKQGKV